MLNLIMNESICFIGLVIGISTRDFLKILNSF